MKILLLTNLYNNFHAGYYYLIRELAQHEEVTCYGNFDTRRRLLPLDINYWNFVRLNNRLGKGWHKLSKRFSRKKRVKDIKRLSEEFDVCLVMQNDFFAQVGYGKDVDFIQCPKAYLVADVHLGYGDNLHAIQKASFDLILFVYKWWMTRLEGRVNAEVGWLPHSVKTEVFKDYGLPKKYDAVSCGVRYKEAYPLREKIFQTLSSDPNVNFAMPIHPLLTMNRPHFRNNLKSQPIRENYAKLLDQSKIFIFGSSIHNYPLAKYFEGMASSALVLAPKPKDAEDLGFSDGLHYVSIKENSFAEAVKYFLGHEDQLHDIAANARELVEQRHSTKIRSEQLRRFLREI